MSKAFAIGPDSKKTKSMWANLGTVSSSDVDGKQFYKEFLYCIMLVSSLGT